MFEAQSKKAQVPAKKAAPMKVMKAKKVILLMIMLSLIMMIMIMIIIMLMKVMNKMIQIIIRRRR